MSARRPHPVHDLHAHSTLSDGADPPWRNVDAAACAGLDLVVLVEHVRRASTHVPAIVRAARELDSRPGPRVRAGIEAKILDDRGDIDAPESLEGVDLIAIADHQLPSPAGPIPPERASDLIARGDIGASEAVGWLIDGTVAAAHSCAARAATLVVHPFSLLPKLGMSEAMLGVRTLRAQALELASIGAAVEVSERWQCPSPRVARVFHSAGVELLAGSDAHRARDVGRFSYVHDVLSRVPGWRSGAVASALA